MKLNHSISRITLIDSPASHITLNDSLALLIENLFEEICSMPLFLYKISVKSVMSIMSIMSIIQKTKLIIPITKILCNKPYLL